MDNEANAIMAKPKIINTVPAITSVLIPSLSLVLMMESSLFASATTLSLGISNNTPQVWLAATTGANASNHSPFSLHCVVTSPPKIKSVIKSLLVLSLWKFEPTAMLESSEAITEPSRLTTYALPAPSNKLWSD